MSRQFSATRLLFLDGSGGLQGSTADLLVQSRDNVATPRCGVAAGLAATHEDLQS